MKNLIKLGCLVLLFLLNFITSASAVNINLAYDKAYGMNNRIDSVDLSSQGLSSAFPDVITDPSRDWNGRSLDSIAANLFTTHSSDSTDTTYYVDSMTLCVAVSSINDIRMFPVVPGIERSFISSIFMPARDSALPVTFPGTMFFAGVCLIGLSSLRRRSGNTEISSEKPYLLKDKRTSFENLAVNERIQSQA